MKNQLMLLSALLVASPLISQSAGAVTTTTGNIVPPTATLTTTWTCSTTAFINKPIVITTTGASPSGFTQSITVPNGAVSGSQPWSPTGLVDGHYFVNTTVSYLLYSNGSSSAPQTATNSMNFWVDATPPTGHIDQVNGQWSVTCYDAVGLAKIDFFYNYGAGFSLYKTVQIGSAPGTAMSWSNPLPMPEGPGQVSANVYDLAGHITSIPAVSITQTASPIQSWALPLYANGQWNQIPASASDSNIAPMRAVAGDNVNGMIQVGGPAGKTVRTISNFASGTWTYLTDAPFEVFGVAGENSHGAIVFGGVNRQQVAYMNNYSSGVWHLLPQAPWPIVSIAGNNSTGVVISGGFNNQEIYFLSSYASPVWTKTTADAPFSVKGIAGDNARGIIVFGDSDAQHVAHLNQYLGGTFATLPLAPAPISFISGDNANGPVVLAGAGARQLYHLNNYSAPVWSQATSLPSFVAPAGLAGNNNTGVAMGGSGN